MKTEKKIDENLYNERALYLLNIKELRDLGRKIGVPAPATLKKQDLVDYILKIVYGEVDAPKRNSFGRPNVREVDMNQYLAKIMKKSDINDELISASFGDVDSIFKVASPDESSKMKDVEQRIFVADNGKFFLRKFAFVESESDIEISNQTKERFGLEDFDVVEVIASGKSFKIISINGQSIKNITKLKNENIGKEQVFHLSTKEEINNEIIKQIKKSKEEDITAIVFSTNDYSSFGAESILADKTKSATQAYKQFMSMISVCGKYLFEGDNIVVITDELNFVEDIFNAVDEDVASRTKKHLQERLNDFLALGNAVLVYQLDTDSIYQ